MPRLSDARLSERNQAIGMLRNSSINHIAAFVNTSRKTIRLLHRRMQQTGTVKDRARTGRPKMTTDADDRRMRLLHLRQRFRSASETARTFSISRQTVGRRLKRMDFYAEDL